MKKQNIKEVTNTTEYDFIDHPKHYIGHKINTKNGNFEYETIEYLESTAKRLENLNILSSDEISDIIFGLKYADGLRADKPDGNKTQRQKIAEDCQKVAWYFNRAAYLIKLNDTK